MLALGTAFLFSLTFTLLSPNISQILSLLHFQLVGLTGSKYFGAPFKEHAGLSTAASRMHPALGGVSLAVWMSAPHHAVCFPHQRTL